MPRLSADRKSGKQRNDARYMMACGLDLSQVEEDEESELRSLERE